MFNEIRIRMQESLTQKKGESNFMKKKRYLPVVAKIADDSQRLAERWLRYGITKGWESCNCVKCAKLLQAVGFEGR